MRYDICKASAPKMPNLGKGTECIKILLSQVSKDVHEPLVPMLFPLFGASFLAVKNQTKGLFRTFFCTKQGFQHAKTAFSAR